MILNFKVFGRFLKSSVLLTLFCYCSIGNLKSQNIGFITSSIGTATRSVIAKDICTDSEGNIYTVGSFTVAAIFGGDTLLAPTATTTSDGFIVKYASSGAVLWAKRIGGVGNDVINRVFVQNNKLFCTGYFNGTINFNTPSQSSSSDLISDGSADIFIANFDTDGNLQWAKRAGGTSDDQSNAITVYGNQVYITGYFTTSANFNTPSDNSSNQLTSASSNIKDIFIAKYDTIGNLNWIRRAGGSSSDYGSSIVANSTDVYIAGGFIGTVNFNTPNDANSNTLAAFGTVEDIFLARYDSNGNFQWSRRAGGSYKDYVNSIGLINNNIYLTGGFARVADFNTPYNGSSNTLRTTTGTGQETDIFLAKFNTSGDFIWAKNAVSNNTFDQGYKLIGVDTSIYVAGYFSGTTTFQNYYGNGSASITSAGATDIFWAKYLEDGRVQEIYRGGGTLDDVGYGIAFSNGALIVSGSYQGTANFNNPSDNNTNNITATAATEAFVLQLYSSSSILWKGGVGNWSNAANWSNGIVPDGSTDLVISQGTPTMDVDFAIGAGKSMLLTGSATLAIKEGITLTIAGTANFGQRPVILKSSALGTASIGQISGVLNNANNVTVERYIPATGRAYRLLSSSGIITSGSIRDNWMEGALNTVVGTNVNPVAGYGTQVTGTGGNANGFDVTSGNAPSIYTSNNGSSLNYTALSNTNSALNPLTGYFVFIRGDRSQNMGLMNTNVAPNPVPLPTSATILRTKGTLVQGTQTSFTNNFISTAGSMNLITNPYACAIDWNLVYSASSNIENSYTFWDPNNGYRGGFVTVNSAGVASTGSATKIIQPGQAFYVTATGAGTVAVSIQESHKVSTGAGTAVFESNSATGMVTIGLYYKEASGKRRLTDGAKVLFGSNYQSKLDGQDALEIANWDENLAITRDGKQLAIETRPIILFADTIPLLTTNLKEMNYELQIEGQGLTTPWLQGWLVDRYTGIKTALQLNGQTVVGFTVNRSPASSAPNRFIIEYSTAGAPPLMLRNFQVKLRDGSNNLNWESISEYKVKEYQVEKSTDGVSFFSIGKLTAKTSLNAFNFYDWYDRNIVAGSNYYRIRAVLLDGSVVFSSIIKQDLGRPGANVQTYPNPLKGGGFTLQMDKLPSGTYTLEWYNNQGQFLGKEQFLHSGGFNLYHPKIPYNSSVLKWKLIQGKQLWKGTLIQ